MICSIGAAQASDICKAYQKDKWVTKDALTAKATQMGYQVRNVTANGGCWEVKALKNGKQVEAFFDPVTLKVIRSKTM